MSQPEADTVLADFISHGEIAISASPAEIWPAIVDTDGWHGTRTVSVGGPKGEVGEQFHASALEEPDAVMLHLENVELEPGRRRTVRIHSPDGRYAGYSSWSLADRGGETVVSYDAYCLYPFPKAMVTPELPNQAREMNAAGLQRLKDFVEGQGDWP